MLRSIVLASAFCLTLAACGGGSDEPVLSTEERLAAPPNLEAGRRAFRACAVCHEIAEGAPHRVGPNLHGVIGAEAGAKSGFAYSRALRESGVIWTEEALDAWIADPAALIRGTRMAFQGEQDAADRRDIIAYMKSVSSPTGSLNSDD